MRTNRLNGVVATLVLGAVLVATLTPSPGTPVSTNFWCIGCGERGGLDVLANIVMFVPLGFAFALVAERRWMAVLGCIVTTLVVESLQINVVVGRDASLSDLLANSVGGWVGTEMALRRRALLRPNALVARRLAASWSGVFALACALTSVGLMPASIPRSLWIQWTPPRTSYDPFTGRLLGFDIDGVELPLGFPATSLRLDDTLRGRRWQATATIAPEGMSPTRSVIVRVAEEFTVLVSVEQARWDLVCHQKTRSADVRFRSPKVALPDAFRPMGEQVEQVIRVTCGRADGTLVAALGDRAEILPLSPALGWLLLSPFDVVGRASLRWLSALWLVALAFPAGYWAVLAVARSASQPAGPAAQRGLPALGIGLVAALVIGLAVAPWLAGVSVGAPWEWAAAVAGVLVGAAAGEIGEWLARRR